MSWKRVELASSVVDQVHGLVKEDLAPGLTKILDDTNIKQKEDKDNVNKEDFDKEDTNKENLKKGGNKREALRLLLIEASRHALNAEELRGLLKDIGVHENVEREVCTFVLRCASLFSGAHLCSQVCTWWEENKGNLTAKLSRIGSRHKRVQGITWKLEAVPGRRVLIYTITVNLNDSTRAPIVFTCSPQDLHDLLATLKSALHRCRGLAEDA